MSVRTAAEIRKRLPQHAGPTLSSRPPQHHTVSQDLDLPARVHSGFGHDFSRVSVYSREPVAQPCPLRSAGPRACPFGGACHTCPSRIQTRLAISQPRNQYEREADEVAERVAQISELLAQDTPAVFGEAKGVQRKCLEWEKKMSDQQIEEDEDEILQAKELPVQRPETAPITDFGIRALRRGGQPLPRSTRDFFEPRFGHDFSHVRIHTDAKAAASAKAVNALAYTMERDVVFGAGQYAPETMVGRRLLAHELAHVVQQSNGAGEATIMRWSYGTGAVPDPTYVVVPEDEKPRVEDGMSIVSRVVSNPKNYPRCHKRFQDLCPSPSANELVDRFNAARVWKETSTDPSFYYGSSVPPDHIAYTERTWRIGRWMIANTAIHEFMHRCGHHTEADIDRTAEICGMPKKPY